MFFMNNFPIVEDVSELGLNDITSNKTVKMLMLFICIDYISLHINIIIIDKMIAILSSTVSTEY